jgi:hypothetical protein
VVGWKDTDVLEELAVYTYGRRRLLKMEVVGFSEMFVCFYA